MNAIEEADATNRTVTVQAGASLQSMLERFFEDTDVILVPSAPGEAPSGLSATGDPIYSRMWNLLQVPCVALPYGKGPVGLPVGVQLIGRGGEDEKLWSCGIGLKPQIPDYWMQFI